MTALTVLRTGPRALVLNLRDRGWSSLGESRGGPFDRGSFDAAQALVGGQDHARGFEVVLGGLVLRPDDDVTVAVTGAACPVTVDGSPVEAAAFVVPGGSVLALGMPRHGLRTYVAVGGGLSGGRTGLSGGFGPQPVEAGDRFAVALPERPRQPAPVPAVVDLILLPGPRTNHLAEPARLAGSWVVSPHSDRVGVRLDGPPLERTGDAEVPPVGLVRGAIQAPPSGSLVVFGPDHPTTGGYPVVGVLTPASCDALGQRRPGETVTLRWG